jgi:putative ABC transport system ATP-binding protein
MSTPAFTLANVARCFTSAAGRVYALRQASFSIADGEFVAIRGRSGAGKSTLLGILGLMDRPTEGVLSFYRRSLLDVPNWEIDKIRRSSIGFLFQQDLLIPHLNMLENLSLPLRYSGRIAGVIPTVSAALSEVGLKGMERRRPHELSGGERTRAALARAIICRPRVLLADEPTGALDTETASRIMELIMSLNASGMTIITVTHDADVAALATRILSINDGVIHA